MERESFWRVIEVLKCKTNDEEGISIKELKKYLQNYYGIQRTRNTLLQDIEAFREIGFNIIMESRKHNEYVYKLVDREFTYDEVRILVDSICINQFLSWKQKKEIIERFNTIISERDIKRLKSRIKINDCIDHQIDLLENINVLHQAVFDKRKIIFNYGKYNEQKEFVLNNKDYLVIPKEIVYEQNRYYLIGLAELENLKKKHYRVDRMRDIIMKERHDHKEKIDMSNFDIRTFDMFTNEEVEMIKMRVHKDLLNMIIERFGLQVSIRPDFEQKDKIIVHQEMGISPGLIRWILNQGSKMEIIEPQHLRIQIKEEIERMRKYY